MVRVSYFVCPAGGLFLSDSVVHSSKELQPHVEATLNGAGQFTYVGFEQPTCCECERLAFSIVSTTVISTRKFLFRAQVCDKRLRSELLGSIRPLDKQPSDSKHVANTVFASCKTLVDGRNKSQSDFAPVFQRNQAIILRSGAGLTPRASATLLRINFAQRVLDHAVM